MGRSPDNQIVIDDHRVSRHHARLTWQGTTALVEDLGSSNGTWVNGVQITQPMTLRPGDTLGLSNDVLLTFTDYPPGGAPAYAAPTYAEAAPASRNWLYLGIGAMLAAAIVVTAILILVLRGDGGPETSMVTMVVTPTTAQGQEPSPSNTPLPPGQPTNTSQPTDAAQPPTYTPYPTYTPFPPTNTPTPTTQPTYTSYPTYTPYPTEKPPTKQPPPPPSPTNTTQPPPPSTPPYTLSINKIEPEPWGRPQSADGCNRPYNDRDPVKRFTIELVMTNNSDRWIPDGWFPTFYSSDGTSPPTCIWYYDNTAVQPGETTYVTFATHVELNDWVQSLIIDELGYQTRICFNSAAQVISCP
jgi:hypothetical protein